MAKIDLPDTDSKFRQWSLGFAEKAALYQEELGLSNEQVEELELLAADYSSAYAESEIYQNFAKSKVATKNSARNRAETRFREVGKFILANANVSPGVKTSLGMSAKQTPPAELEPPTKLVVTGSDNGTNHLRWERNGNSVHTMFMIEAKIGVDGTWQHIGGTKRLKFDHLKQTPGVQVAYRIRSQRSDKLSAFSNTAIVYLSEQRTISLPKAA